MGGGEIFRSSANACSHLAIPCAAAPSHNVDEVLTTMWATRGRSGTEDNALINFLSAAASATIESGYDKNFLRIGHVGRRTDPA